MSYFINIDLENTISRKLLLKHVQFSIIWFLGIVIVVFPLDVVILNYLHLSISGFESIFPLVILSLSVVTFSTQKWYFSIAFIFYPILIVCWFIPKIILKRGKIYLFFNYLNSIYDQIKNIKQLLFHTIIFLLALALLLLSGSVWSRIVAIIASSYFFFFYSIQYLSSSFKPAKLFGLHIEKLINELIQGSKKKTEFLDNMIEPSAKEVELPAEKLILNQALRLALIDFAIDYASSQLNGFRGKKAYVISIVFGIGLFFLSSIIYFWFINVQLFNIDPSHFLLTSSPSKFDFLYYTFKTITFSDIDSIKPYSVLAKIIEMISFFSLGIMTIVVVMSIIFGLKQDKIKENLQLTKELCTVGNSRIREYGLEKLNIDIQIAKKEVQQIKESMEALKKLLERLF